MSTETKTVIEQARPAHYQAIADIYNIYIRKGNATMDETLKSREDITAWMKKFNDREGLYVLLADEKVIGWGIIKRYSDREGYRFTGETAVYLEASELGKGYGTKIKKFLIDKCKTLNYRHLVAKIFASNEVSINYNLKLGYTIVGKQTEIGFRNGKWMDVAIMQLILK